MNFAHNGAFRCDLLPLTSTDQELSGRTCRVIRTFLETSVVCGRISFVPTWYGCPPQKRLEDCKFPFLLNSESEKMQFHINILLSNLRIIK